MSDPIITQAELDALCIWVHDDDYGQLFSPRETVGRLLELIAKQREALKHVLGELSMFDVGHEDSEFEDCEDCRAALALVKG